MWVWVWVWVGALLCITSTQLNWQCSSSCQLHMKTYTYTRHDAQHRRRRGYSRTDTGENGDVYALSRLFWEGLWYPFPSLVVITALPSSTC